MGAGPCQDWLHAEPEGCQSEPHRTNPEDAGKNERAHSTTARGNGEAEGAVTHLDVLSERLARPLQLQQSGLRRGEFGLGVRG